MNTDIENLPDDPRELKVIISKIQRTYEKENQLLREQVRLLYAQLFGKKSEKGGIAPQGVQLPLFDMPEPEVEPEKEKLEVPSHTREKAGRKKLPETLPRVEIVHDIPEAEKVCGCGHTLSHIGQDSSEKLDIIPAVIQVIKHVRLKYACKHCEGLETEGSTVKIAPLPKQIIEKGIASAGLLAHIFIAKFCDALPFCRQEKQFDRLGVVISRANMSNWAMKSVLACGPLMELLERQIRAGPLLNIDETTVQVLREPGRSSSTKSYMWVRRGGPIGQPVLIFHYSPHRSGVIAESLLSDYSGVVQSDGYSAYNYLDDAPTVEHAGCWAHARRKFTDAQKAAGKKKKPGSTEVALAYIRKIYEIEKEGKKREYSTKQLVELRKEYTQPVLDDFKKWLCKKSQQVTPGSLVGKAVKYNLNQWDRLTVYLAHGDVTPDNNLAENAIRPFVVGRKNWLFAGSPDGARASAVLYSIIETAKANNLEPYSYLRFLFEKIPFAATEDDYKKLLPHNLSRDEIIITGISGV